MGKGFEPPIINAYISEFIDDLITKKGNLAASKPFETAAKPIDEYEERMLVKATDKFDVAVYIAAINFYLNQGELHAHRARGAVVLYMDSEVADKIFKAAGLEVPYDEDDEHMLELCGSLCQLIANSIKDRLADSGYAPLIVSDPGGYRNSIPEGVEFSKGQDEKQELSFYFLKHKALVVDWTMAPITKK